MTAIRRHLASPAMLVACVALIVAFGGVSYAAGVLPKNSVGTVQLQKKAVTRAKLKRNAVTSAKVKNGALLAADFRTGQLPAGPQGPKGDTGPRGPKGPQGLQGTPGHDATKLFADIVDNGGTATANVVYGSGVTAVSDPAGDGWYAVTFNRSLKNCVVQAIPGFGDPHGGAGGGSAYNGTAVASVNVGFPGDNQASVHFTDAATKALTDTSFLVTAFC